MDKTEKFLDQAFGKAAKGVKDMFCPCNDCGNRKIKTRKVMEEHLCKFGFTPNYTRWVYHSEAHRIREEAVRPRLEEFDGDARVAEMLGDFHEATFVERPTGEEEPEPTAKAFYEMLSSS
jgi:hypothetical protein